MVLANELGGEQTVVGFMEELRGRLSVIGTERHSECCREVLRREGAIRPRLQRCDLIRGQSREERELVATDTRDHVGGLGVVAQDLADALECRVACSVSMN